MFKYNQPIKCIDASHEEFPYLYGLTEGKTYYPISDEFDGFVWVKTDRNEEWVLSAKRFTAIEKE